MNPQIRWISSEKLLKICKGSMEMLKTLVEDFIDFTRFENESHISILKENVKIRDVIHSIKDMFEVQAEEKKIEFIINISNDVPQVFKTDPIRLKQILMNLLNNSMKFTIKGFIEVEVTLDWEPYINDKGERIDEYLEAEFEEEESRTPMKFSRRVNSMLKKRSHHLELASKNNWRSYLHIRVKDTGIGMCKEETQRLFQKFLVLESSRNMNRNGLGLGLYLCKEIWMMLGGDIYWESKKGVGSTFIIEFAIDPKTDLEELLMSEGFSEKREITIKSMLKRNYVNKRGTIKSTFLDAFENLDEPLAEEGKSIQLPYDFMKTNSKRANPVTSKAKKKKDVMPSQKMIKSVRIMKPRLRKSESFWERFLQPYVGLEEAKKCSCTNILLVDDLPFNILAIEIMIKDQFNLNWDKAFSGDQAISMIKSKMTQKCWKSYKLIIMDFYMPPGINGAEATEKIKLILQTKHLESYVVCLTAQREGDFEFNKKIKVFDDFYPKPLSTATLKSLLEKLDIKSE